MAIYCLLSAARHVNSTCNACRGSIGAAPHPPPPPPPGAAVATIGIVAGQLAMQAEPADAALLLLLLSLRRTQPGLRVMVVVLWGCE
eukprot:4800392-Amphidinium_carterae.1